MILFISRFLFLEFIISKINQNDHNRFAKFRYFIIAFQRVHIQGTTLSFTVHKSKRNFMDALQSRLITLSTFRWTSSNKFLHISTPFSFIHWTTFFRYLSLYILMKIWRQLDNETINLSGND